MTRMRLIKTDFVMLRNEASHANQEDIFLSTRVFYGNIVVSLTCTAYLWGAIIESEMVH